MPIITRKTIHSYSTEDAAFPAKNLLENHKTARWKCKSPGEKTAFVVIKLDKPYHINKLDVGNEWSAFMEIFVGNSQQDPPEYKELILTSSFMTEKEARSEQNPNRIRFFEKSAMVESVAEQQWDLVKIICTQPFNTRKQFGVAFITLYTPDEPTKDDSPPPVVKTAVVTSQEEKPSPATSKSTKKIGKFTFRDSSDEEDDNDDTSPFKKWKMKKDAPKSDFKSQIKSKLEETRKRIRSSSSSSEGGDKNIARSKKKIESRNRSKGLMYESSDDEPNEKLQKKIDKDHELTKSTAVAKSQVKSPSNKFAAFISDDNPSKSSKATPQTKTKTPNKKNMDIPKKEPQYKPFNKLMEDVVFVISGYVNPERGTLRQKALDMGARYKGDWDNSCTHLICAFANTPKFNQVKGKGKIVSAKWIESCFSEQKRLPWRRFAVDRDDKQDTVSEDEILCEWHRPKVVTENQNESDSDGDMLIVDNRKKTPEKKQIIVESDDDDDMVVVVNPPASPPKITIDDDENETENAPMEVQEAENDEEHKENVEASYDSESSIDITMVECEAFKGKTFYLNDDLPATTIIKFKHVIKHMLGTVTKDASKANYIITKYGKDLPKNTRGEVVKDLWIEECHDLQAFIPTTRYKL